MDDVDQDELEATPAQGAGESTALPVDAFSELLGSLPPAQQLGFTVAGLLAAGAKRPLQS